MCALCYARRRAAGTGGTGPIGGATFLVSGRRTYADAVPFDVSLVGTDIQGEVILTATLTATQISGPTGR